MITQSLAELAKFENIIGDRGRGILLCTRLNLNTDSSLRGDDGDVPHLVLTLAGAYVIVPANNAQS